MVDHGFDSALAKDLQARLKPLIRETQPYAKKIAHRGIWVEPSLLAEIEYQAKSVEGKVRHPFSRASGRIYELGRGLDVGTVSVLLGVLAAAYLMIQTFVLG